MIFTKLSCKYSLIRACISLGEVRKIETIKSGQDAIGASTRVKIVKNKVAPPFKQAEFDIMFNEGISKSGSILDTGVKLGLVRKSGAFFYLDDEKLGQGRENAKDFLKANPDTLADIEGRIRATAPTLGFQPVPLSDVPLRGGDDDDMGCTVDRT